MGKRVYHLWCSVLFGFFTFFVRFGSNLVQHIFLCVSFSAVRFFSKLYSNSVRVPSLLQHKRTKHPAVTVLSVRQTFSESSHLFAVNGVLYNSVESVVAARLT